MADDGMESYSPELKFGGNDDDSDLPVSSRGKVSEINVLSFE
jgi:hypothetical protein